MKNLLVKQKRFPWIGRVRAVHSTFQDDGGGCRTVPFPGQSLYGGPLFRTQSLPVKHFAPPGASMCACVGARQSSPLELLTHNLLLAPAGIY